jgi:DNA-binding transcriptional LysR family regulator
MAVLKVLICPARIRKTSVVGRKSRNRVRALITSTFPILGLNDDRLPCFTFSVDNLYVAQLENFRLKVFRTVAESLSFRKAAERLFLTQPAVTLQIKALEDELGVRLFDRTNQVSLTPQGSILLRCAQKMAALASETEQALGAAQGRLEGKFDLGVSSTISQYVLPRLIGAFVSENPRVQLTFRSGNTEEIVKLILEDSVPIGLIEGPARHSKVHTEPFMEDELVLIAHANFELDRLTPDQLPSICLLVREPGSGSRLVVETALKKAGLKMKSFRRVTTVDSTEAIKSAVEAGFGVGFVSRWAILKELELRSLKVAEVAGVRMARQFSLVFRSSPEPQGIAAAFREFTLSRARLLSPVPREPARQSSNR